MSMPDGNIHGRRNGKKIHTLNSSHLASDAPSPAATTTVRAKNTKTNFISLQLLKSVEENKKNISKFFHIFLHCTI